MSVLDLIFNRTREGSPSQPTHRIKESENSIRHREETLALTLKALETYRGNPSKETAKSVADGLQLLSHYHSDHGGIGDVLLKTLDVMAARSPELMVEVVSSVGFALPRGHVLQEKIAEQTVLIADQLPPDKKLDCLEKVTNFISDDSELSRRIDEALVQLAEFLPDDKAMHIYERSAGKRKKISEETQIRLTDLWIDRVRRKPAAKALEACLFMPSPYSGYESKSLAYTPMEKRVMEEAVQQARNVEPEEAIMLARLAAKYHEKDRPVPLVEQNNMKDAISKIAEEARSRAAKPLPRMTPGSFLQTLQTSTSEGPQPAGL